MSEAIDERFVKVRFALDPDDGADVTGLRIRHHETGLDRTLDRARGAAAVRVVGEDVGAIAISHPVIVGTGAGAAAHRKRWFDHKSATPPALGIGGGTPLPLRRRYAAAQL